MQPERRGCFPAVTKGKGILVGGQGKGSGEVTVRRLLLPSGGEALALVELCLQNTSLSFCFHFLFQCVVLFVRI